MFVLFFLFINYTKFSQTCFFCFLFPYLLHLKQILSISKEDMKNAFFNFEKENRTFMTKREKVITKSYKQMTLDLPAGKFIKPVNETGKKVNYIAPFLSTFVNKDHSLLKWPEVDPREKTNKTSRKKRPDAIFYTIYQAMLGNKIGFGEVKLIESKKVN
ncbi:uncharacterized protein BX663DRAFT_93699 [Cokeromyces recurvatus]|uniref:uncharacterized protein n=1 Tax=Cokeromyces recurvatus TaxID=90255 RepID=UPI00221F0B09|nr:uncharacterized protein BX663DRAFT_93699 [Cokeromyces recurvatus]KAI7901937.1 hypothetical protein BX663DRAFT_93699 [Cokeromyces recurvatus]